MANRLRAIFAVFAIAAGALAACSEELEPLETEPRPIRAFVVSDVASEQTRRYSGVIEATDTSALSFSAPGTVIEVSANVGDDVDEGDILARLDPAPFELDLEAAEADLARARADLELQRTELSRQRTLFARDWISAAALQQHEAAYAAASSGVDYAASRVSVAQRNLNNTTLHAPFDGRIAERAIEPFQELGAGQTAFRLNGEDALQIAFTVPESGLNQIEIGQSVEVRAATVDGAFAARITEIAATARDGNAFPVEAGLLNPSADLRPGMTAQATLQIRGDEVGEGGFLVPLTAIAPGEDGQHGYVFRFNAEAGAVERVSVRAGGVRGNLVAITEGLESGDIIASAGVSFLLDGQEVRLLNPQIAG